VDSATPSHRRLLVGAGAVVAHRCSRWQRTRPTSTLCTWSDLLGFHPRVVVARQRWRDHALTTPSSHALLREGARRGSAREVVVKRAGLEACSRPVLRCVNRQQLRHPFALEGLSPQSSQLGQKTPFKARQKALDAPTRLAAHSCCALPRSSSCPWLPGGGPRCLV